MLVDTRKEGSKEGFAPNTDNTIQDANATIGQTIGWYVMVVLCWLTIIGGIVILIKSIEYKNYFQKKQIEINSAASSIDIMLQKRRDTLIKLLEQTKSYMKFEKETLTNITALRSIGTKSNDIEDIVNSQKIMDTVSNGFKINFENYPNLKSNSTILELMSSSQYLEIEIASARRLYNKTVNEFNSRMFVFPEIVIATKMKLTTFAFIQASEESKKDVDMNSLENI